MDQKIIIITSGDVNRVLDNCETRNALGEIGIDITWCGYNVAIKRFISFTDIGISPILFFIKDGEIQIGKYDPGSGCCK